MALSRDNALPVWISSCGRQGQENIKITRRVVVFKIVAPDCLIEVVSVKIVRFNMKRIMCVIIIIHFTLILVWLSKTINRQLTGRRLDPTEPKAACLRYRDKKH